MTDRILSCLGISQCSKIISITYICRYIHGTMYVLLGLIISIQCMMSSAQLATASNRQNPLQIQNVNPANSGVQFPSQELDFVNTNPKNTFIETHQNSYLQAKGGINEAQQYSTGAAVDFKYHNYDQMTKVLRQITARYPSSTALYSIGKSVQGKLLNNSLIIPKHELVENLEKL